MLYPPLTVRQMNLLIQFANIHAAAMKVSLSQISDPEESRRLHDDAELLESTAEGLSEILGLIDGTNPVASTITPTFTRPQAAVLLDTIAENVEELEIHWEYVEDEEALHMLQKKIGALRGAANAIRNEL